MKNFIFTFLMLLFLVSCETKESVTNELNLLKTERTSLQNEVANLSTTKDQKLAEISDLDVKIKEMNIISSGNTPKYILKLRLKQSHFSLDIGKHIKDEMNAIEFELPVDKEFYNSVSTGTNIVDEFRTGSFILSGSFGDWEMTVKGKEIR